MKMDCRWIIFLVVFSAGGSNKFCNGSKPNASKSEETKVMLGAITELNGLFKDALLEKTEKGFIPKHDTSIGVCNALFSILPKINNLSSMFILLHKSNLTQPELRDLKHADLNALTFFIHESLDDVFFRLTQLYPKWPFTHLFNATGQYYNEETMTVPDAKAKSTARVIRSINDLIITEKTFLTKCNIFTDDRAKLSEKFFIKVLSEPDWMWTKHEAKKP